jgi:hypothetical protein
LAFSFAACLAAFPASFLFRYIEKEKGSATADGSHTCLREEKTQLYYIISEEIAK